MARIRSGREHKMCSRTFMSTALNMENHIDATRRHAGGRCWKIISRRRLLDSVSSSAKMHGHEAKVPRPPRSPCASHHSFTSSRAWSKFR